MPQNLRQLAFCTDAETQARVHRIAANEHNNLSAVLRRLLSKALDLEEQGEASKPAPSPTPRRGTRRGRKAA